MPNINDLDHTLQFGDKSGGNTLDIATDGTPRLRGDATCWKGMIGDLFGRRLQSNQGNVDYDYNELAIKFQKGGNIDSISDTVCANIQLDHNLKAGNSIHLKPHMHWFADIDSSGQAPQATFVLRYRLQRNGQVKNATWTDLTVTTGGSDDVFTISGTNQTFNQVTKFPEIVLPVCNISDTIQFKLARTDNTYANDILVYFLDMHVQIDSFGSEIEFSKLV